MQGRAVILEEVGKPVVVRDVQLDAPRPGEVLVRLRASGVCHTDLEVARGEQTYPLPIVLGHEGAGIIEAVGPSVQSVRQGDHVVCAHHTNCATCFYCDSGQPLLCETFAGTGPHGVLRDGTSRMTLGGQPLYHFLMASSHAEYCVLPESMAVRVPPEIPLDRACLLGCGVATGVAAVWRLTRVRVGASVVVVGCGAVGLNVLQAARVAGAGAVIGVDLHEGKLELARVFGATDTVNPAREDVVARVRAVTNGRGADFAFEAGGTERAMRLALEAARPGAEVVILGKVSPQQDVSFRFGSLMGDKRITRSAYGGARPHEDFPRLAAAYLAGRLKLDELLTRRIRLEDVDSTLADIAAADRNPSGPVLVRAVVVMDG